MTIWSDFPGKVVTSLVVLSFVAMMTSPALAWGSEGHRIVARIADKLLTHEARNKVRGILKPGETMVGVALWADGIRGSEPGKRPETPNWHFADTPLGSSYSESRDCAETPNGSCVIAALVMFQDVLADKKKGYYDRDFNRNEALKFIIHFAGDIHQPLHNITDKRTDPDGDNGGNGKTVIWFGGQTTKKLHGIWDTDILRRNMLLANNATVTVYASRLFEDLSQPDRAMARPGSTGTPTVVPKGTIEDWAKDAHELAEDAYRNIGQPNSQRRYILGQPYFDAHRQKVDRQLQLAGVRLARILNENLR